MSRFPSFRPLSVNCFSRKPIISSSKKNSFFLHNHLNSDFSSILIARTKLNKPFPTQFSLVGLKRHFHSSLYLREENVKTEAIKIMQPTKLGKEEDIETIVDTLSQISNKHLFETKVDAAQTSTQAFVELAHQITHFSLVHPSTWFSVPMIWFEGVTGLPWWSIISIGVIAIRIALLPFLIKAMRNNANMQLESPNIQQYIQKITDFTKNKQFEAASQAQKDLLKLYKTKNLNPFKSFVYTIPQVLPFLWMFFAVRDMSRALPSFKTGGLLWFTDLSQPGGYLSIVSALAIFIGFKFGTVAQPNTGLDKQSQKIKKYSNYFFYAMMGSMVFFTTNFSAGVHVFWIASGLLSSIQIISLTLPSVRSFLNIPNIPKSLTQNNLTPTSPTPPTPTPPVTKIYYQKPKKNQ